MLDFSGEPRTVSALSPQQSAGPEVLQQSPVLPSQQSFVVEAVDAADVLADVVDGVFEFDELELLSPAQPVKRERTVSTDAIFNLLFIFITFHIKNLI